MKLAGTRCLVFYFVFFDQFSQNVASKEGMWLLNSLGKDVTGCSLRDITTPIICLLA